MTTPIPYPTHKLQIHDDFERRYIAKMGAPAYELKRTEALALFRKMGRGARIDIAKMVKEDNVELFIKLACQFIEQRRREGYDDYVFSDDYSAFLRTFPPQKKLIKKCNIVTL